MSREGVYSRIVIGGTLKRSQLYEFVDAIHDDDVIDVNEPECEQAAQDGETLQLEYDNSWTGEWDMVTLFCKANDLTYYFWTDGGSDAAPVSEFWRPGMDRPWNVYAHDDVVQVYELVRAYREGKTLAEVIAETVPPPRVRESDVPPVVIEHDVTYVEECDECGQTGEVPDPFDPTEYTVECPKCENVRRADEWHADAVAA